jgi:SNF2 family DNA or RNA helicase
MAFGINIPLWDFQVEDLEKATKVSNFLNGNDMGTGKTRWAVALDLVRRQQSPDRTKTLVICNMTAFVSPWIQTFNEFAPHLRVMSLDTDGAYNRNKSWKQFTEGNYDVLVLHWHALNSLPIGSIDWLHIIADEVHKICSRKNKWTRNLKRIKSVYRTGLSGTLSKGPADTFWSPLNWIMPKTFSDYWRYRREYTEQTSLMIRNPETGKVEESGYKIVSGPRNEEKLRSIIAPNYCCHKKKTACCPHHPNGVRADMPDKLYDEILVTQPPVVMKAYHEMRRDRIAWVEDVMQRNIPITAANAAVKMMRLIQFADSYATVDPETNKVRMTEPSAKLDALMDKLSESDDQIVVWSNFKQVVKMVEARLDKAEIPYSELTGDIKGEDREAEKQRFIKGASRVLVGTIATGAESIDGLQMVCDTAVFIDRSYSVLDNNQAEDRLWRSGQENNVHIIDIRARGTLDAGRYQQMEKQWAWIHKLLIGEIVLNPEK